MKALIVSGGLSPSRSLLLKYLKKADCIIGADKGCEVLYKNSIRPNYILGDFDSADLAVINSLESLGAIKIQHIKEKDFTDTESALDLAVQEGATQIIILGATGTRYDHVLGNICLLYKGLNIGVEVQIIDDNNKIFMVNKNVVLSGEKGQIISFQAYSDTVKKFTISGAKYELNEYDLKIGNPLTISNEFIDSDIKITFDSGTLMVLYTKD